MKRTAIILFGLMLWCGAARAAEVSLPEGFQVLAGSGPVKMVLTPYATYPVLLEHYVSTLLIEGGWGEKQGQFGAAESAPPIDQNYPNSIAVNSKGEIYILDLVNNRIQKFSPQGKYLKQILVRSFCTANGTMPRFVNISSYANPYYKGQMIVFDLQDHMYYYCDLGGLSVKGGEVWEFQNDQLIAKYKIPAGFVSSSIEIDGNGEVWSKEFNVKKHTVGDHNQQIKILPWVDAFIKQARISKLSPAVVEMKDKGKHETIHSFAYYPLKDYPNGGVGKIAFSNNALYFSHGWYNASRQHVLFIDKHDVKGGLVSVSLMDYATNSALKCVDQEGNIFELRQVEGGMRVIKWNRVSE